MFCWPRHRAPKPGSPNYTTPHSIRRRCRPQTTDRGLPGATAYLLILRCAADAKVIVTGYRERAPSSTCPRVQPLYDKPIHPLYARWIPSASGPVVNGTNLHTLRSGRRCCFGGRRKRCPDRKPANPGNDTCAGQYGPPVSFPTADALLVQQAFQLVRLAMSQWLEHVSWAPVPEHERLAKSVVIQNRPVAASFLRLFGPVNLCEAKIACQARNGNDEFLLCKIDCVLELAGLRLRCIFRARQRSGR